MDLDNIEEKKEEEIITLEKEKVDTVMIDETINDKKFSNTTKVFDGGDGLTASIHAPTHIRTTMNVDKRESDMNIDIKNKKVVGNAISTKTGIVSIDPPKENQFTQTVKRSVLGKNKQNHYKKNSNEDNITDDEEYIMKTDKFFNLED